MQSIISRCLLLWQALVLSANAQFVTPPSSDIFTTVQGPLGTQIRYKEVATGPGSICELNSTVKSYSGFVDVSENQHIFFWFFEAKDIEPTDAHLTAWISGGPGASSMSELFTEHGPCRIDENLNVIKNPYAWNTLSNTVYIDQPVTVGFSYSTPVPSWIRQASCDIVQLPGNTCPDYVPVGNDNCDNYGPGGACGTFPDPDPRYTASTTPGAAVDFYLALQGIYAAFPQYTKHGFTLGSESYGGHYAPVFSKYIQDQNADLQSGAIQIPQTSVIVNNGWFDPAVAYAAHYSFIVDPGNTYDVTISRKAGEKMADGLTNCLAGLSVCNSPEGNDVICKIWDDYCTNDMQNIYDDQTGRDEYDVREIDPDPFPPSYYVTYLNTLPVLTELGVFTNYTDQSQLVGDTFEATGDDGKELGITQALSEMINAGIGVTLMHGDADYDCNWYGGQVMAERIANGTNSTGLQEAYAAAGFENLTTSDNVVHGQVKQAGLLTFVRVYESGHQVGFFQPLAEQAIFDRTIKGLDISRGVQNASSLIDGKIYRTSGSKSSTFREGTRTVQYKVLPANATYNTITNEPEY